MKVVHATWEQRNLGVHCHEITVDPNDSAETMVRALRDHETQYTVVRLPVGHTNLLFRAQELGYRFIETMTYVYHTGSFNLNPIQQRIVDRVRYEPMDEAWQEKMFAEIMQGMFSTDRVSLDPRFSPEQANRRYIHWIKDELARGGRAFKVLYGDRDLGFFTLKRQSEGMEFAFLSGVYAAFRTSGFGFCCHYSEVVEGIRAGAKRVMTSYSSNNRGAAGVHLSMGHILQEQWYILVKHGARPSE